MKSDPPHSPDLIDETRAIVIGSVETLKPLCAALAASVTPVKPIGAVLSSGHAEPVATASLPVELLGHADDLAEITQRLAMTEAILCIPAAMNQLAERITAQLESLGIVVRRIATLRDQLEGRGLSVPPGSIDPTRLLGRAPRAIDRDLVTRTLTGKRVLITGAGGSIGSELARIVASFAPAEIQLMERAENNLFEIDRHLAERFPGVSRRAILHDVTDAQRTADLVAKIKPQVIFHAAAHKHVPMMEEHPRAALVNNFLGTKSIADAANAADAERFVMISTDKAVHPSSVMGATKRTAELYVQNLARSTDMACSMVRFGNVLGSACSVVPIWSNQLSTGGPITVTDRRMTRFFMTIPEAASLVIQAASLQAVGGVADVAGVAGGVGGVGSPPSGSVFLLDMGEPIHIHELALRFVRLHGLEPQRDVDITFTGIRPGEKLHEQLAYDDEDVAPTAHPAVSILRTPMPEPDRVERIVERLESLAESDDRGAIIEALRDALPEMTLAADRTEPEPHSRVTTTDSSAAVRAA